MRLRNFETQLKTIFFRNDICPVLCFTVFAIPWPNPQDTLWHALGFVRPRLERILTKQSLAEYAFAL